MSKNKFYLKNCNKERVNFLLKEISKLRWWITGYEAGTTLPNSINLNGPPLEGLRQLEIILKDSLNENN